MSSSTQWVDGAHFDGHELGDHPPRTTLRNTPASGSGTLKARGGVPPAAGAADPMTELIHVSRWDSIVGAAAPDEAARIGREQLRACPWLEHLGAATDRDDEVERVNGWPEALRIFTQANLRGEIPPMRERRRAARSTHRSGFFFGDSITTRRCIAGRRMRQTRRSGCSATGTTGPRIASRRTSASRARFRSSTPTRRWATT